MSEETSSKYNKLRKRVKLAVGKSRNSKGNVKTLDFKENGFQGNKKGQSRRVTGDGEFNVDDELSKRVNSGRSSVKSKGDNVDIRRGRRSDRAAFDRVRRVEPLNKVFGGDRKVGSRRIEDNNARYVDETLHKRVNRGRSFESNTKSNRASKVEERYGAVSFENGGFKLVNSDRKRKRIYADLDSNGERTFQNSLGSTRGKDLSQAGWNKVKDGIVKDRRTTRGESRDSEQSSWGKSTFGRQKSNKMELIDEKGWRNMGARGKDVDKVKIAEHGTSVNGVLKKFGKSKSDSSTQLSHNQKKYGNDQHAKKKTRDTKNSADDSAATDDRPKKKKRGIRLDPNDITNKRLDDGTATIDKTTESKEDSETNKSAEISKNAQFRSIQPSPSILSFVEENLLGRRREIEFRRAGYNIELSVPLDNIPLSTSSERERIEETAFRNKLTFFAAAKVSSSFPPPDLPEIAFAGRSNVGKSSLLNSLTRQWGVVRTSDKPGLTQTINFFNLGSKLCLVDLPGYGFAYAKEEVKESWEELVKEYVSTRVGLKRVCLLIDTKWGMKPRDHELIDLMERSKTKYQIVLTKTDLVFPIDVARRAMQIEESLKARKSAVQPLMMVSSKTGAAIRSLRTVLANVARFARL